jgi:hypothetical protein
LVVGEAATAHDFCEACYLATAPEEAASKAGWVSQEKPPKPLPTREQIERITAKEYLDASARASANSADKPVFRHICAELEKMPEAQARLALEFLPLIWRSLEQESGPPLLSFPPTFWARAVAKESLPEYTGWMEKIGLRCFELLGQHPEVFEFKIGLQMALMALHRVDRSRFVGVMGGLKSRCEDQSLDKRSAVLSDIERLLARGPDGDRPNAA